MGLLGLLDGLADQGGFMDEFMNLGPLLEIMLDRIGVWRISYWIDMAWYMETNDIGRQTDISSISACHYKKYP